MARRFVILLIVVLGIAAVWSGAWLAASIWLRGEIDMAKQGRPALACDHLTIAGFPFRFDVTCTGASLTDGDLHVAVGEVRASTLVYMPTFVELFADGPAAVEDAFTGATYQVGWDKLQASVRLDGFALARASLVADGLTLKDTLLAVTEKARVPHAEVHVLAADGATGTDNRNLALFARIDEAVLQQLEKPVSVEVSALLTEWPADVRIWGAPDLIPFWAAGDGSLGIDKAAMTTGELTASISGAIAPDGAGLLDGALTLTSRGFGPMMRKFLAAPLAGALLGREDAAGDAHQTLRFTHSVMRAGIVPLLEMPPLF